jgi:hypothetical protein
MLLEAFGSVLLGLALALGAHRLLPARLPVPRLVLATGVTGALFGSIVTHSALGPGHLAATLLGSVAVSAALLSLLIRPGRNNADRRRVRRSATA